MDAESIQPPRPFQAEYEDSIPFTRSNLFKHFTHSQFSIWTSRLPLIRTLNRLSFARRGASSFPLMICFVVLFVYRGSTLTVVCRPCASSFRSVSSASPPSVKPP